MNVRVCVVYQVVALVILHAFAAAEMFAQKLDVKVVACADFEIGRPKLTH